MKDIFEQMGKKPKRKKFSRLEIGIFVMLGLFLSAFAIVLVHLLMLASELK